MTTTTIPTESGTYTAEYTNECSCEISNETYDEFAPADDCYGHCWEFTLEDFENITEHLFTDNEQGFTITGFPIWNEQEMDTSWLAMPKNFCGTSPLTARRGLCA